LEVFIDGHDGVVDLIQEAGSKFARVSFLRYLDKPTQGLPQVIDRSLFEQTGQSIGGGQEAIDLKAV
jgi:hypothetical protein